MDNYSDIKQSEKGAWLSLLAYILLSAVKLFIGTVSGSQALLADGLNNSTDIIASLAILTGLRISRRPRIPTIAMVISEQRQLPHWSPLLS